MKPARSCFVLNGQQLKPRLYRDGGRWVCAHQVQDWSYRFKADTIAAAYAGWESNLSRMAVEAIKLGWLKIPVDKLPTYR